MNPYLETVSILNESKARYVIVGGFALVMHGGNRFTPDINVVVELTPEALESVAEGLTKAGLRPGLSYDTSYLFDIERRDMLCMDEGLRFFPFLDERLPNFKVDIFLEYPLPFKDLVHDAVEIDLGGMKSWICSFKHLFRMKEIAGRPQDQLDLESLQLLSAYAARGDYADVLPTLKVVDEVYAANLVEFSKLSCHERLKWLEGMLSSLGGFCFVD